MSLRTPLGHAKGLGSAKEGVSHWWVQRLTAVALVPLTFWIVFAVVGLIGAEHAEVTAWMAEPVNATLLLVLVFALFYHSDLGLQVIIEDYVSGEGAKMVTLIGVKFAMIFLAVLSAVAVLQVGFGGQS